MNNPVFSKKCLKVATGMAMIVMFMLKCKNSGLKIRHFHDGRRTNIDFRSWPKFPGLPCTG